MRPDEAGHLWSLPCWRARVCVRACACRLCLLRCCSVRPWGAVPADTLTFLEVGVSWLLSSCPSSADLGFVCSSFSNSN